MSKPFVAAGYYLAPSSTIAAGGTGYLVGNVLTLTATSATTLPQVTVTSVAAVTGAVTGIVVTRPGVVATFLPNAVPTTGGAGTGFTINATWVNIAPGNTTIQIYGTNTSGRTPPAGSLQNCELFVNTADATLFVGSVAGVPIPLVSASIDPIPFAIALG